MSWVYLFAAGLCEMAWPLGFKYTGGFKRHYPLVGLTFVVMIASFGLMSMATNRGIPVGTAYAVWTGLGAVGTVILGMVLFDDPRDAARLCCLGLVIVGVVGLKLQDRAPAAAPPAATIRGR